jgi:hypothetical protein
MPLTAAATRPRAGPGTLDLQQRNSAEPGILTRWMFFDIEA